MSQQDTHAIEPTTGRGTAAPDEMPLGVTGMNPGVRNVSGMGATTTPTAAGRFARHYVEMLVVMLVGTLALGRLEPLLTSTAHRQHVPAGMTLEVLLMAAIMTVAMAAWMRFRHHRPRLIAEIAAGMNAPFLVLVPLSAVGIGEQAPMTTGHVSMYLGMSAAMVLRRHEFHPAQSSRRHLASGRLDQPSQRGEEDTGSASSSTHEGRNERRQP